MSALSLREDVAFWLKMEIFRFWNLETDSGLKKINASFSLQFRNNWVGNIRVTYLLYLVQIFPLCAKFRLKFGHDISKLGGFPTVPTILFPTDFYFECSLPCVVFSCISYNLYLSLI